MSKNYEDIIPSVTTEVGLSEHSGLDRDAIVSSTIA